MLPLFLVVLSMLSVGDSDGLLRQKRQLGGFVSGISCASKVPSIHSECTRELGERSKALKDADMAGDVSTCCYFVAYRQCVKLKADEMCGGYASEWMDSTLRTAQGVLVDQCSNYDYLTPSCIFVLYYPWIIIASVILVLVGIGCCLGACCCH